MTSTERKTYHFLCVPCEKPFHKDSLKMLELPATEFDTASQYPVCPECESDVEPIACPLCGNGTFHEQFDNRWCASETCTYMEVGDGF